MLYGADKGLALAMQVSGLRGDSTVLGIHK
jgi:hypothetical protein